MMMTTTWIASLLALQCTASDSIEIVVEAGEHRREACPVQTPLPDSFQSKTHLKLVRTDDDSEVPVQWIDGNPASVVWILQSPIAKGESRRYRLTKSDDANSSDQIPTMRCATTASGDLLISAGDRPVMRYNATVKQPPPNMPASLARSGYIHPLHAPTGQVITDDFCTDGHAHQRGVFFAWTKSSYNGRQLDFWNLKEEKAKVEHVRMLNSTSGNICARFTAEHRFVDLTAPGGDQSVLNERWLVSVFQIADTFLFDIESTQTAATDIPLIVGPYHYGGMAIRGNRQWNIGKQQQPFAMLTSEGLDRSAGNHTRPHWVDFGGELDHRGCGVTIFCHPDNFRAPQTVRLNPKRPYFSFTPQVESALEIAPNRPYVSRYRFLVYSGKKDPKRSSRMGTDYQHPPKVRLVNDSSDNRE